MSSLTLLPSGQTLDYWWERLHGQTYRRRFLLTKIIEVMVYRSARTGRSSAPPLIDQALLDMEPRIQRNHVGTDSGSVTIVPARCRSKNDTDLLIRCLDALLEQETQVIVVDDGSSYWPDISQQVLMLRHESSRGPAAARNTGIKAAFELDASVILFTDSDCIPSTDWVEKAHKGFLQNPFIHVQSGNTISAGSTWFDTYHNINGTLNGRRFKGSDSLFYGPTCNLAISRVLAKEIVFDESFPSAACEDIEYCLRILEAGYRIVHNDSMQVKHDYQYQKEHFWSNIRRFCTQFRKYATAESLLVGKSEAYYGFFGQSTEIPARIKG